MGRARPVTRTGRAWGTATITAVTATAAVFLAGCGTRIADQPARGRPASAAPTVAETGAAREPAAGAQPARRAVAARTVLTIQARTSASSRQAS
jgi:hypothetical protein